MGLTWLHAEQPAVLAFCTNWLEENCSASLLALAIAGIQRLVCRGEFLGK